MKQNQSQKNTTIKKPLPLAKKQNPVIPFVLVFLIPVLLYIQTLAFDFSFFDDDVIIIDNISFLSDFYNAPFAFLTDAFISKCSSFYRPMQTLSYMTDIQLSGGNNPWMYHLTNVLLLGCIACSLFIFFRKLSLPVKPAILGSLIYCMHPLFISSVAWIPARGDLQLTLFSLLSFIFFIEFLKTKKNNFLFWHWITFTIALFCKESAMLLPILFVLYYFLYTKEKRFEKKYFILLLLYAISGILMYWMRIKAIGSFSNDKDEVGIMSVLWNLRTIPEAIAMFFIPYKIAPIPNFSTLKTVMGIVIIIVLLILFFKNKERSIKEKIFCISWFLIFILPPMFYRHPYIDYLDHRFFSPMIGVLLFVLYLFPWEKTTNSDTKRTWIFIAVIIFFSSFTLIKSWNYSDPLVFYDTVISQNPKSTLAYFNRGCIKRDRKKDMNDVIADFSKAIELNPKHTKAYNNRGFAYGAQGFADKAIADYSKAIELEPDYADPYSNRAGEYYNQKKYDKAIADYSKAIELKPKFPVTYYNRGNAYSSMGSFEKAISDYTKAIELDAGYADAFYNRGNVYNYQGLLDNAIADYSKSIELKPDNANVYFNRGVAYHSKGISDKAIADFSKVIELNPNDAGAYFSRGNEYIKMKLFDEACADYKNAEALGLNEAKENISKYCK
ncbi:MAG TPA: tetratricopeptide repeat protein [Bacteroidales bacterium]|nr:tetratricopeptide repeat protein [Bacteroidales bacterium]HPS16956.1 tetratricopeptide repeat protein [Bacteroidales bacterium]